MQNLMMLGIGLSTQQNNESGLNFSSVGEQESKDDHLEAQNKLVRPQETNL